MSLDTETLRQMVFEYLRNQVKSRQAHNMQWNYVLSFVGDKAREQDPRYPSGGNSLNDRDGARLKHVLWDMIIERILVPGSEQTNIMDQGWPIFSLTEYGKKSSLRRSLFPTILMVT